MANYFKSLCLSLKLRTYIWAYVECTQFLRKAVQRIVWKNEKLSLSEKNSSNQLLSKFFSKTSDFTKFLWSKCVREFLQFPYSDVNTAGFLSHNFRQKFREISFITKNQKCTFCFLHTVWRERKLNRKHLIQLLVKKKICESNLDMHISISNMISWFHGNFALKVQVYRPVKPNLHLLREQNVQIRLYRSGKIRILLPRSVENERFSLTKKTFRQINYSNFFSKNVTFTKM